MKPNRYRRLVAAVVALALALPGSAFGAGSSPGPASRLTGFEHSKGSAHARENEFVSGEVIVRFDSATVAQKAAAHSKAGAASSRRIRSRVPGLTRVKLKSGVSVASAISAYEKQKGVLYAQPNYVKRVAATLSDPRFSQLWGLNNTGQTGGTADADIDAPEAWDFETGSSDTTVAVIDTGIDYRHPDLAANVWTNPGEVAGNGIDDDHNGYPDDVHGWDAVNGDGDPMDDFGHGTHVSGTIGAPANNGAGVAGVNWNVKLVSIKMLDAEGSGTTADELEAFAYADAIGAKVINCSWGGYSTTVDTAEYQAIAALDALVVCAAGNESNNNEVSRNDPTNGYYGFHYPSNYDLPNIVAVGASDANDALASFSNYGATQVDLFAPGVDILSTVPGKAGTQNLVTVFEDPMTSLAAWDNYGYNGGPAFVLDAATYASAPASAYVVSSVTEGQSWLDLNSGVSLADTSKAYALKANLKFDLGAYDAVTMWAVSDQRSTWQMIGGYTGSTSGVFRDLAFDLSSYAGNTGVRVSVGLWKDFNTIGPTRESKLWVDDVRIVSSDPDYSTAYESWNGTSMATPHVAGAAGLLLAARPDLTVPQLKSAMLDTVDPKAGLSGKCVTGGRLNLAKALASVRKSSMAGTVTSGGEGLGGVTVAVGSASTVTTTDGTYLLSGLIPGSATATFSKVHYKTVQKQVELVAGVESQVNATLEPNPGSISGIVRDAATNALLSGVTVSVAGKSSTTSANGSYSISDIAPGSYTVSFSKTGYGDASTMATVSSDEMSTVDILLSETPGSLTGSVNAQGLPLSGVSVAVAGRLANTAADGSYSIVGIPPGSYTATFTKAHYAEVAVPVEIVANLTTTQDVTLVANPGSLSGRVMTGGSPLSGVTVSVAGESTLTAADGSYSISGVAPGSYTASFSKAHYGTQSRGVTIESDRASTQDVSLVANPGSLSGSVMTGGSPLSGATVSVAGKSTSTAADGSYSISGIAPGTYTVTYSKAAYGSATESVVVNSDEVTSRSVSLTPLPGSLSGVITDAGLPVAGALVTVGSVSVVSGADGSYAMPSVVPGAYSYSVISTGYYTVTGSLSVAAASSNALNVSLTRVVPKASVTKSPSKSSLTYKRKKGVAKLKLSATFKGWNGTPLAKRTVYLQTSKNGKTGWKNTYKLTTSSTGKASKSFKIKRAGTKYYRWYAPAKSRMNLKTYAAKQKVRVK